MFLSRSSKLSFVPFKMQSVCFSWEVTDNRPHTDTHTHSLQLPTGRKEHNVSISQFPKFNSPGKKTFKHHPLVAARGKWTTSVTVTAFQRKKVFWIPPPPKKKHNSFVCFLLLLLAIQGANSGICWRLRRTSAELYLKKLTIQFEVQRRKTCGARQAFWQCKISGIELKGKVLHMKAAAWGCAAVDVCRGWWIW